MTSVFIISVNMYNAVGPILLASRFRSGLQTNIIISSAYYDIEKRIMTVPRAVDLVAYFLLISSELTIEKNV